MNSCFTHPGFTRQSCRRASAQVSTGVEISPEPRVKYRQLCMAGKPSKVAITAVMRKLLLLANALIQKDNTWAATVPGYT